MDILKPKDVTINCFIATVTSYSEKIEINILETQGLTKLRDTLLPKLISGKIRISKNAT